MVCFAIVIVGHPYNIKESFLFLYLPPPPPPPGRMWCQMVVFPLFHPYQRLTLLVCVYLPEYINIVSIFVGWEVLYQKIVNLVDFCPVWQKKMARERNTHLLCEKWNNTFACWSKVGPLQCSLLVVAGFSKPNDPRGRYNVDCGFWKKNGGGGGGGYVCWMAYPSSS